MADSASFDSQEDAVVSLEDIIDEQKQFEDTANAVLGASDSKNCTYDQVSSNLHTVLRQAFLVHQYVFE